jgi:signal transduction histidine kinase
MLTSYYMQNLSGYFQHSDQFYYILTDLKGNFVYANPLFQKKFSHIAADFSGVPGVNIFIISDKKKYQQTIQECLEKPGVTAGIELKLKSQEDLHFAIRWEFSAYSNAEGRPEGIQAIGIAIDEIKKDIQSIDGQGIIGQHLQLGDEKEIQKQKQLMQATIDGQEKERLEIGKELHDNINQHLTTTRLYLEVVRDKVTGESFEMINLAHKGLSDIINEIRQLSQSLVPTTLGDLGLIESIQDICDSLRRTHTFAIDFYHKHFKENGLPDNLKLMLFRIIQEQVNNIIRHSHANMIQIRLQTDAEYIILVITDNGKGFDSFNYKKGLGLTNITNRAGLFNGQVEIDAAPGNGCSLSVTIPSSATEKRVMN